MPANTTTRRSRFKPQKSAGMDLTDRDMRVLRDVFLLRVMSREQVQRLHFSSETRCSARLRRLYDWQYLHRSLAPTAPYGAAMYSIGREGARAAQRMAESDGLVFSAEDAAVQVRRPTLSMVDHALAVGDVFCAFRVHAPDTPHLIGNFIPERLLRDEFEVRGDERGNYRWRREVFAPDGCFRITAENGTITHLFLECDKGCNNAQWIGKLRIHSAYLTSSLAVNLYGTGQASTLVVTTSRKRQETLSALALREMAVCFRFTTFDTVRKFSPYGRIWHVPGRPDPVGLLDAL